MKRCLILFAAYNGAKFLRQQIDSIRNQTYTNWRLLIRDDGSNDGTVEIVREYCEMDDRIELILNDTERHGAFLNFWQLIDIAYHGEDYDYYFFSDQDDIWEPNKIERMVEFAEEQNEQIPMLFYSDMKIIDGANNIKLAGLNEVMGIGQISGYTEFYSGGYFWGCCIMLNAQLFKLIPPIEASNRYIDIMSHDNFYAKLCLLTGKVFYIDETLIQHREHEANHTKGYRYKLNPFAIIRKCFAIKQLSKVHANGFRQTLVAFDHFRKNGIDLPIMHEIEACIRKGGFKGLRLLKKHGFKRYQRSRTIGFKTVVLLKSYKKYLKRTES